MSKGAVILKIGKARDGEEEDTINSFTLSGDGKSIVTHHKSSLFKLWNVTGNSFYLYYFTIFKS